MADKKLNVWMPLALSIVMLIGIFIGYELRDKTGYGSFLSKPSSSSVAEVLKLIQSKYVDEVTLDSISTNVINQLLSSLDPHSSYIPAEDLSEMNDEIMGNFQGIGIEYQLINDSLNVVNVLADGPAKKAGLKVGDICIKANDSIILSGVHIKPDEIRKHIRGLNGSVLKMTVIRNGKQQTISIIRSIINLPSVDAVYLADTLTGYIHINKFTEQTHLEFMKAIDSLNKLHINKLILDLRGNGGGLLEAAINIADEFLSDDKLIVFTEGAHSKRINYACKKDGMFETGKLEVLVDETSASASEVLSGALQDWDRATIIGRRTFGKGLVQQQFMLSDGSAVRLTTAKYYTPLGRNIQKPYYKNKDQYKEEIYNRYHNRNQKDSYDSTKLTAKTYKTPSGHVVYGGGGITPDVVIPFDTSNLHGVYYSLLAVDQLSILAYHWFTKHQSDLQTIKNLSELNQYFDNNKGWWNDLLANYSSTHFDIAKATEKDKKNIETYTKSFVAHVVLNKSLAAQIINQEDSTFAKAIQNLK